MVELSTPRLLNMRPAIIATVKYGSPCTRYSVGTQVIGERREAGSACMVVPCDQWCRKLVALGFAVSRCVGRSGHEPHRRPARRFATTFEPGTQRVERARRIAPGDDRGRSDGERLER